MMNPRRITLPVLTLALLLVSAQAALAKEMGRVVISGPGLKTPIEIIDPEVANRFGLALVDDLNRQKIDPPKSVGEDFYTIDRGFSDKGTIVGYDHVRYYPNPETGRGWFQYMGTDGYKGKYDGAWFQASPEGERAVLEVLADHGVTFKAPQKVAAQDAAAAAEPRKQAAPQKAEVVAASAPPAAETAPPSAPLIVGMVAVLMLAIGAGVAYARARARRADG